MHEDDALLVLNKPSGLAVHGGSGISLGAIELLRAARPDARFLELAHRLDRDTSGCLVIAKKRSALRSLHEAFRTGGVTKIYAALLSGRWQGGEREVNLPLVTSHRENGERFVRVGEGGKPAVTRFFPERIWDGFVMTRVELLTGRTHQIRVHAAALNCPVAGDERYGAAAPRPELLRRLYLHAEELGFRHPVSGETFRCSAPRDENLRAVDAALARLPEISVSRA